MDAFIVFESGKNTNFINIERINGYRLPVFSTWLMCKRILILIGLFFSSRNISLNICKVSKPVCFKKYVATIFRYLL
jgi:hypothetical protein